MDLMKAIFWDGLKGIGFLLLIPLAVVLFPFAILTKLVQEIEGEWKK